MDRPPSEVSFTCLRSTSECSPQQRYYIDPPSVTVTGRPSAALAEKLENEEKKRVDAQIKKLGSEGLKKAEKELEEAKAEHDTPIPSEILKQFKIPDVKSIAWIPVKSVQQQGKGREPSTVATTNPDLAKHINADGQELPFFVQYDDVEVRSSHLDRSCSNPRSSPTL